jgi:hypothetical protein
MPDAYLHIGLPKTGTTFLQRQIFPNIDVSNVREECLEAIVFLAECIDGDLQRLDWDSAKRILLDILSDIKPPYLISHEGLVGDVFLGFHNRRDIADFLKFLFPDAVILITLRRQDEFIESIYTQLLHTCYSIRFSDFLCRNEDQSFPPLNIRWAYAGLTPRLYLNALDWSVLIKEFERAFGCDRIEVSLYEDLREDPVYYLTKMSESLGVPTYIPKTISRENVSYSNLSAHIALFLNRFIHSSHNKSGFIFNKPFSNWLSRYKDKNIAIYILWGISSRLDIRYLLQNIVNRIPSRTFQPITAKQRHDILAFYADSNAQIDRTFSLDMKRHGYY